MHRKKTEVSEKKFNLVCTYVSELHHADLPQLTDTAVGWLWLEEKLGQGHLLTAKQLPHNALPNALRGEYLGRRERCIKWKTIKHSEV